MNDILHRDLTSAGKRASIAIMKISPATMPQNRFHPGAFLTFAGDVDTPGCSFLEQLSASLQKLGQICTGWLCYRKQEGLEFGLRKPNTHLSIPNTVQIKLGPLAFVLSHRLTPNRGAYDKSQGHKGFMATRIKDESRRRTSQKCEPPTQTIPRQENGFTQPSANESDSRQMGRSTQTDPKIHPSSDFPVHLFGSSPLEFRPLQILKAFWLDVCPEESAIWLDPEIIEFQEAA